MKHPANFYDRSGLRYSNLLVLSYAGQTTGKKSKWLCRCDCGVEKEVSGANLQAGNATSCGCFGKERRREQITTHGDSNSPEFRTWTAIQTRCHCKTSKDYENYGARGLVVCDRWRSSFSLFLEDMGRRPSPKHQIERVNNNLGYNPENCIWATVKAQANNRRSNHILEFSGKSMTVSQWAERLGIWKGTIRMRLKAGWSVEQALTTPVQR